MRSHAAHNFHIIYAHTQASKLLHVLHLLHKRTEVVSNFIAVFWLLNNVQV